MRRQHARESGCTPLLQTKTAGGAATRPSGHNVGFHNPHLATCQSAVTLTRVQEDGSDTDHTPHGGPEMLRVIIQELCSVASVQIGLVADHAWIGDDAGVVHCVRQLTAYVRQVIDVTADLAEVKHKGNGASDDQGLQ